MKSVSKILLFLMTVIMPSFAFGQLPVTFDASTRTFTSTIWKVKAGEDVTINVNNFNPYLFNVEIKIEEQYFEQKAPPSLMDNVLTAIASVKDLPAAAATLYYLPDATDTGILKNALGASSPKIGTSSEIASAKEIINKYQTILDIISDYEGKVMELYDISVHNANGVSCSWLIRPNTDKIEDYKTRLSELDTLHRRCLIYIHDHKDENAPFLDLVKTIRNNLDEGALKKIFREFHRLEMNYNPNLFTFSSASVRAEGDAMEISIKITPRDSSNHPAFSTIEATHTIDVYGYWQPGFSSGFVLSGVTDERYAQRFDETTQKYCLLEEGSNSVDIGINALTHVAYRVSPGFAAGFHAGAGMTIKDNPSLQILAGGSLIFGKRNRLALNAGIAAGRRDEILKNLDLNKKYIQKLETVTKKQTAVGWQFSLTYNFSISKA